MPWRADTIHAASELSNHNVSVLSAIVAVVVAAVAGVWISFKRGLDRR